MEVAKRALITSIIFVAAHAVVHAENPSRVLKVSLHPSSAAEVTPAPLEVPLINILVPPPSKTPALSNSVPKVVTCGVPIYLSTDAAIDLVSSVATQEHFDANLLSAIASTESHFQMEAVSPKGAIGVMQLMPETATRFGVNPCDATENVRGAIRYLKYLQARYQNPLYVLAAYNAGEDAVDRNHGIPPFPETVAYVAQVLDAANAWPVPGDDPASAKSEQSTKPTPRDQTNAWSQGFVMHLTPKEN